jgi:hypothetical protein
MNLCVSPTIAILAMDSGSPIICEKEIAYEI